MPAAHPMEVRRRAVALARSKEMPIAQLAADLGISESRLRRWMRMASDSGKRAAAAVGGVAVLQVIVFAITTAIWFSNALFAGNACSPGCDTQGMDFAAATYFGTAAAMFVCSGAAIVVAWRTGRDLAGVPLIGCVGTALGLWGGLTLLRAAVG